MIDREGTEAERAAAELTAALATSRAEAMPTEAALPAALAARIVAEGEAQVRRSTVRAESPSPDASLDRARTRTGWTSRGGWMLAAAATLAWLVLPSPLARASSESVSSSALLFDSLRVATNGVRAAWEPSADPAATAATGEVVWDATTQRGVMRISGLTPNDPKIAQYQLWIIDAERDARYPVDGGVFDVTSAGEVYIPVSARLAVERPTLFAVTLERPGGVVVSTRERLVLAAPVKS